MRAFPDHARLSYAKVAEYQRRGLVHFHAVVRLDGSDGPADAPSVGLTVGALHAAVLHAARAVHLDTVRPDGVNLALQWDREVDLRPVTAAAAAQLEDEHGDISDEALAGYLAKYATRGTGCRCRAGRLDHL